MSENLRDVQEQVEQGDPIVAADPTQDNDLIARVNQYQVDNEPEKEESFDLKELEAIEDPVAKEQAMKAYKSFQRGYGSKFQELAELKKEIQETKESMVQNKGWSVDRIQSALNDPDFVKAANEYNQKFNATDEYSTRTPEEKQEISGLKQELETLKEMNKQTLTQQQQAQRQHYHDMLETKYSNYERNKIDVISADMIAGKITVTPEHVYKAEYHDENIRKAYKMGREDERKGITEQTNAMSFEGTTTTQSAEPILKEPGESSKSVWRKIMEKNMTRKNVVETRK